MRILQVIHQLLPIGTDRSSAVDQSAESELANYRTCPAWPPDIFAVLGTIIDRSGCYTEASPNPKALNEHRDYLDDVASIVASWTDIMNVPVALQRLWQDLVDTHGELTLDELNDDPVALKVLFKLFAIADEASQGMGWSLDEPGKPGDFQMAVLINAVPGEDKEAFKLPHWPRSLCRMVSPDQVVVLPKSITADKGCTVRSLSHNLALLPCETVLRPEWRFVERTTPGDDLTQLRLLLVPFPYTIPDDCFELAYEAEDMGNGTTHAAFFKLCQNWLKKPDGTTLTAAELAVDLILPLIDAATNEAGGKAPHGVILPECALDERITDDLGKKLRDSGIEFLICGVLDDERAGERPLNKAYTIFMDNDVAAPQNKQHRWRVDKQQADSYQLDFDKSGNQQWWEDIDVSKRGLPFYAFRKDTSMVTLICEDLARMEPAMNAIRAVGPNLVVALLMDGPQLGSRWPGRYAGVLADEPGCAVLSLTCAATVDRSNEHYKTIGVVPGKPAPETKRIIGRWTERNTAYDIDLPEKAKGVLLTLRSDGRHQTTLDNRGDRKRSRELRFVSQKELVIN